MAITDWPEEERPREKLLKRGADALSDAELLAIFLRTGVAGKTAVDLARDLLTTFGGLGNLLAADHQHFCAGKGLGDAKYTQLQAVLEMGRRYLFEKVASRDVLNSAAETRKYLALKLRGYAHEVFACLFLDSQHRLIAFEELFRGTLNSASVHPREVVKATLHHNAAGVIFAHNHPSGSAQPSHADKQITQQLSDALALIDVSVLDHIIVGATTEVSFAERGLL